MMAVIERTQAWHTRLVPTGDMARTHGITCPCESVTHDAS